MTGAELRHSCDKSCGVATPQAIGVGVASLVGSQTWVHECGMALADGGNCLVAQLLDNGPRRSIIKLLAALYYAPHVLLVDVAQSMGGGSSKQRAAAAAAASAAAAKELCHPVVFEFFRN